jgi:hypothetical protein
MNKVIELLVCRRKVLVQGFDASVFYQNPVWCMLWDALNSQEMHVGCSRRVSEEPVFWVRPGNGGDHSPLKCWSPPFVTKISEHR